MQSYLQLNQTDRTYGPMVVGSLYASYVYERLGKSIIEVPEGFATFYFIPDYCYIEDVFVLPEHRRSGIAKKLTDKIAAEASLKGYKKLLTSVLPGSNGCTNSTKAILAYGFNLSHINGNLIFFTKDI